MTFERLLTVGIIFLYSFGALGIFLGALSMRRRIKTVANLLTLAGFSLHSLLCVTVLATRPFDALSAGYFMQMLAWCILFVYFIAWQWLRLSFLALTAAPLALLLFIFSIHQTQLNNVLPDHLAGLFIGLHLWSLFLSMGLLALAFGAGLVFLYLERRIKTKAPMNEFVRDMPALSTFDKINKAAVLAGFPLYTIGLMAGFVWGPMLLTSVENPKVILSLCIWFLYALLFYQRAALGYRGRKTAIMAIGIFLFSIISIAVDYSISHHSQMLQPQSSRSSTIQRLS